MSPEELQIGSMYKFIHAPAPGWDQLGTQVIESFGGDRNITFVKHYETYRKQNNRNMCQWFENDLFSKSRRHYTIFDGDSFILLGVGTIHSSYYSGHLTYMRVLIKATVDGYIRLGYVQDSGYDLELLK